MNIHRPIQPSGYPDFDPTMAFYPAPGGQPTRPGSAHPYRGATPAPRHPGLGAPPRTTAAPMPPVGPYGTAAWPGLRPVGYPQPTPRPEPTRPSRRKWLIVGTASTVSVAAALAVVMGTGVGGGDTQQSGSATPSTTAPSSAAPSAPPVSTSALRGLLLSRSAAAEAIGATTLGPDPTNSATVYEGFADDTIADQECISLVPSETSTHAGSKWLAARTQYLQSPREDLRFVQAVVAYPDAVAATDFIATVKGQWDSCSGRSINFQNLDDSTDVNGYWSVGPVSEHGGTISVSRTQEGADGWVCHTSYGSRNNVVVETRVCGDGIDESLAQNVVDRIGDQIDAQP